MLILSLLAEFTFLTWVELFLTFLLVGGCLVLDPDLDTDPDLFVFVFVCVTLFDFGEVLIFGPAKVLIFGM